MKHFNTHCTSKSKIDIDPDETKVVGTYRLQILSLEPNLNPESPRKLWRQLQRGLDCYVVDLRSENIRQIIHRNHHAVATTVGAGPGRNRADVSGWVLEGIRRHPRARGSHRRGILNDGGN